MGLEVEQPVFHLVLDGRTVGPYDRRTIVGMRIKNTLSSEHELVDASGMRLTVADLIGRRARANDFNPNRTGGFSIVQATYPASLVDAAGGGFDVPRFRGEMEVRVQSDVLRIAGRSRHGLGWREGRIKIPLPAIVHARVRGAQVDLWLRAAEGAALQQVVLELFTHDAAGELVEWLPGATPPAEPASPAIEPVVARAARGAGQNMLWVAVAGMVLVVGVVLTVLFLRRLY